MLGHLIDFIIDFSDVIRDLLIGTGIYRKQRPQSC